jgi:hypothetical protein
MKISKDIEQNYDCPERIGGRYTFTKLTVDHHHVNDQTQFF